jgi:periplasmic protein TonB
MTAPALAWFEDDDSRGLVRWGVAGAVVVGVYAALIAGYLFWHEPDEIGDDAPVVSVELAPIDSVADAHLRDVAPAPEEMVEQKATPTDVPKPPDEPKVDEPPPPDVTTADIPLPQQKPPEKMEETRPPAPMTAAPVAGGAPKVDPSWESALVRHLQQYKRYPGNAQARNEQGTVLLGFSVDRGGHVLSRRIVRSSGHPDLDEEVLALVLRAQPLPAFPASMTQVKLDLTVPIRFSLR